MSQDIADRQVHAKVFLPNAAGREGGEAAEIVRYDRAGKWYYESPTLRRHVSITEAVQFVDENAEVFYGRPGGLTFDRQVKAKRCE